MAISASNSALWDHDVNTGQVHLSEGWSNLLGGEAKPTTADISDLMQMVHVDDREMVKANFKANFVDTVKGLNDSQYQVTHRVKKHDGSYIWIVSRGSVTERDENGRAIRLMGIHHNITLRKQAEDALRESEEKLRGLYELSPIGIALTDIDGHYIEFNDAFQKICGYSKEELNKLDYWTLTPKKYASEEARQIESLKQTGRYGPYEKEYIRKDGSMVPIQLNGMIVTGQDGRQHIWSIVEDISERKKMEAQVNELAFYDSLTKLPNRRLMNDRLDQVISASKRNNRYAALMVLDLDNFKPLNDQYGHAVGDLLLIEVANRLQDSVREVDTVARFGGDEFIVLLAELDEDKIVAESQVRVIAEKIRSALSEPYKLEFQDANLHTETVEHHCSSSIGVTLFLGQNADSQDIIKAADAAMYQVKKTGRNQIAFR